MRAMLLFLVIAFPFALTAPAPAQEKLDPAAINKRKTLQLLEAAAERYRTFYKPPEKTFEYWVAIQFEMDLGKFELAALHLKRMLGKDETPGVKFDSPADLDKALVALEEAEGISAFLRLQRVKLWSDHPPFHQEAVKNADELVERVTKAVKGYLSDKARIQKYIKQLDARTPEERGYALIQVLRSGDYAVPELIETLRTQFGKSIFSRAREVLLRMGRGPVPIYLEIFKDAGDANAEEFRLAMLDLIHDIRDDRVVPYLWHMSAAKRYPESVRKKATQVLSSLLRTPQQNLPDPKVKLTLMAEQYYQHKYPFSQDEKVTIWEWDGNRIQPPIKLNPYRAEEFFAERYAREALDLDPSYKPAQVVFLSLMLDRTYRPKIQTIVGEPLPPNLQKLLTSIDTDLILRVMERAMEERQIPIVLPLIKALGERGDSRTIQANPGDQPRGIARALYYADRRVQYAGMEAALRMPSSSVPPVTADRIVELSRRFLASELKPKALVAYAPAGQEQPSRQTLKDLGFEAELAVSAKDLFDTRGRLKAPFNAADYDFLVVHKGLAENDFAFAYGQIRRDYDLGGMPTIIVVDKAREKAIKKFVARDLGVIVITDDKFTADGAFKDLLDDHLRKISIAKLTDDERRLFAKTAMDRIYKMSRGEITGYDIAPTLDVVKTKVKTPEFGLQAMEIVGRFPGRAIQAYLAGFVSDPNEDIKTVRMPAVLELNRHMQRNGVLVDKNQLAALKAARDAMKGTPLGTELNVTVSMFSRTGAPLTGRDLLNFQRDAAPVPPPMPKEEKKDN